MNSVDFFCVFERMDFLCSKALICRVGFESKDLGPRFPSLEFSRILSTTYCYQPHCCELLLLALLLSAALLRAFYFEDNLLLSLCPWYVEAELSSV